MTVPCAAGSSVDTSQPEHTFAEHSRRQELHVLPPSVCTHDLYHAHSCHTAHLDDFASSFAASLAAPLALLSGQIPPSQQYHLALAGVNSKLHRKDHLSFPEGVRQLAPSAVSYRAPTAMGDSTQEHSTL